MAVTITAATPGTPIPGQPQKVAVADSVTYTVTLTNVGGPAEGAAAADATDR